MGDFSQNTGSLLPVMHPVKFDKENLWADILSPVMIWEYLDREGPYHEELLELWVWNIIFLNFFVNKYYE